MPDRDFNVDLRDIRFALFETLPFDELLKLPRFSSVDKESVTLLLDEALKFFRDRVAPLDGPGDKRGCTFEAGKVTVPEGFGAAYHETCDNGWLAIGADEELGGMALPYVVELAAGEMQVGACCSLSLALGLTTAAASLLNEYASEELKATFLPQMVTGEWQGTMCLTEPQAGSAVGDTKTTATRKGDRWLISGTKIFITAGEHDMTKNHVHLVLARTPDAPKGIKGISLFLVPKYRVNADGSLGETNDVVCAGIEHKMGIHASATCVMSFGENDSCEGFLIGEECQGIRQMFHMMNHARLGVGLQGVGLASQAFLYAREYAKERVQGTSIEQLKDPNAPRVAIAEHPDVRRMLLWQKSVVEGCRALLYYTAFHHDLSRYAEDDKQREEAKGIVEFLTPICKAYTSDMGFEVTRLAMQTMGGYGYIAEYPLERRMRDIKIASIYEGTNGIQALDLLGRKLTAKSGLYFRQILGTMEAFAKSVKGHEALDKEVEFFATELDSWKRTTMMLGIKGMSGDRLYPVLCATDYLQMTGNVVTAWLLLYQASIAHTHLERCFLEKDAEDWESRDQLYQDDPEARYLFNKLKVARFFTFNVLSRNRGIAAQIASEERSSLNWIV